MADSSYLLAHPYALDKRAEILREGYFFY